MDLMYLLVILLYVIEAIRAQMDAIVSDTALKSTKSSA